MARAAAPRPRSRGVAAAVLGGLLLAACAAPAPPEGLEFVPPAPGTYGLPPIQEAADGVVLDTAGRRRRLFDYFGDRHVLLSFIYTRCADSEGCPLATGVLGMVRDALASDPDLAAAVRLVSLSFDPARDSTAVMRRYAGETTGGGTGAGGDGRDDAGLRPWVFLTTPSAAELQPILDGYGQSIVPEIDAQGRPTGDFSHVLKVYLIDRRRRVRNIYSTSYLHPAIAINDLRTLVLEETGRGAGS